MTINMYFANLAAEHYSKNVGKIV